MLLLYILNIKRYLLNEIGKHMPKLLAYARAHLIYAKEPILFFSISKESNLYF
jgi:hypothetical protein